MNNAELTKQTMIGLWNSQCSNISDISNLDRVPSGEGGIFSIAINKDVSMMLLNNSLKIVFGDQLEYASEIVSEEECESLCKKFLEAEARIVNYNQNEILKKGIDSLNSLLANLKTI
jgi:hypothetical protein